MRAARRLRPPEWPPAPQRGQADPERSTRRALGPVVSRVGARGETARRGLLAIGGTGSPGPRVLLHGARGWEESAVTQGWGMGTGPRGSSAGKPARGGKCLGLVGHPLRGPTEGSCLQVGAARAAAPKAAAPKATAPGHCAGSSGTPQCQRSLPAAASSPSILNQGCWSGKA